MEEIVCTTILQSLAAVVLAAALFFISWLILRAVRFKLSNLAGPELELAALIVAVVSVVLAGVYVPNRIDHDNRIQQGRSECFASVVTLRRATDALELGYLVAPLQRDQRLGDWRTLETDLENTQFSCRRSELAPPGDRSALEVLRRDFAAARADSERRDPNTDFIARVRSWSTSAMQSLQLR